MARRTKQPKPTIDGVISKIERADFHFQEFQQECAAHESAYSFVGKVAANKVDHVYFPNHIPPLSDRLALTLGDCVHNLRCALDHIAYLMVKSPNRQTQFPILERRPYRRSWCGRRHPATLHVSGGLTTAALTAIEAVQPYNGSDDGKRLLRIHELDVIDKHRHLFFTASSMHSYTTADFPDSPDARPPIIDMWNAFGQRLEHGKAVLRHTYAEKNVELDPHLQIQPQIILGENSGSIGTLPPRWVIGTMPYWLRYEFLPRFQPFFR